METPGIMIVMFIVGIYFTAESATVNCCKCLDDNSCVEHKDCCSSYCFKPPHLKTGVCKQLKRTSTQIPTHLFVESGICSYYKGSGTTASGEPFNDYDVTAAHRILPFGTMVKIEYGEEESIVVRINDRGPFINGRILDVSLGVAVQMGIVEKGVVPCRISVVNDYGGINNNYGSSANNRNFNYNTKKSNNKNYINCKKLLDNTCVIHSDCCSGYCYKKLGWAQGICKPSRK